MTHDNTPTSAQILFLVDISSSERIFTDLPSFKRVIQSIMVQIFFLIKSSKIFIISKAVDLKATPPLLRYRCKSFYPIHSEQVSLDKIYFYVNSMIPSYVDPTPYSWDIIKLYLHQALSDYPWNHSNADNTIKCIFLFSASFEEIAMDDLYSFISTPSFKSHNIQIFPMGPKNLLSCAGNGLDEYASMVFCPDNPCHASEFFNDMLKHHSRKKKLASVQNNHRNISPPTNVADSASPSPVPSMLEEMFTNEIANVKKMFTALCVQNKSLSWWIFLYFFCLFQDISYDAISSLLSSDVTAHEQQDAIIKFFSINADTRAAMLEALKDPSGSPSKLRRHFPSTLFEQTVAPLVTFFHLQEIKRSEPFLRLLFILSPFGRSYFLSDGDLLRLIEELVISYAISTTLQCPLHTDGEQYLLERFLSSWPAPQCNQIKAILLESEILADGSMQVSSSPDLEILSPSMMEFSASTDSQCTPKTPFGSRPFLQSFSSYSSIEVTNLDTLVDPLAPNVVNNGILVYDTPIKEYVDGVASTPRANEGDQDVIIAETPQKFIASKRSLKYTTP